MAVHSDRHPTIPKDHEGLGYQVNTPRHSDVNHLLFAACGTAQTPGASELLLDMQGGAHLTSRREWLDPVSFSAFNKLDSHAPQATGSGGGSMRQRKGTELALGNLNRNAVVENGLRTTANSLPSSAAGTGS